ncbi:MAG: hypothetical protein PVI03_04275 [Candidatus Thorarchaeota archaeon]
MHIVETINCPMNCGGQIAVIMEDNIITSHGVCPQCDRSFSAERLNFAHECMSYLNEYMEEEYPTEHLLNEVDREVTDFYQVLYEKYLYVLYKQELEKMGGC